MELKENEIIANAFAVKYHSIEYSEGFVTITQNRTRRRIYNGYYFDEVGNYIYVSEFYAHIFQHKKTIKKFIVNTVTKECREIELIIIKHHIPEHRDTDLNNEIESLRASK